MDRDTTLYALTNAVQPVRRAWLQAVGRALADTGIPTPLALAVLLVSRLGPAVQQKILAVELGVNPAGLVRILDQGEAAGLLTRNGAKGDRRSKVIDLLPDGERLARRCEAALVALRRELIGDTPPEDVDRATKVLRSLEQRALQWARRED